MLSRMLCVKVCHQTRLVINHHLLPTTRPVVARSNRTEGHSLSTTSAIFALFCSRTEGAGRRLAALFPRIYRDTPAPFNGDSCSPCMRRLTHCPGWQRLFFRDCPLNPRMVFSRDLALIQKKGCASQSPQPSIFQKWSCGPVRIPSSVLYVSATSRQAGHGTETTKKPPIGEPMAV